LVVAGAIGAIACGGRAADNIDTEPEKVPVTTNGLHAVWGSSGRDVWAVGNEGTILHADGSTWSLVESGTQADLHGVHGLGPDDAWAVGDGVVLTWTATRGPPWWRFRS